MKLYGHENFYRLVKYHRSYNFAAICLWTNDNTATLSKSISTILLGILPPPEDTKKLIR
ncbi:hypothetical protein DSUL_20289 [Desulfovibrionales bacterium]